MTNSSMAPGMQAMDVQMKISFFPTLLNSGPIWLLQCGVEGLDSSDFFMGHQVVKSPKKTLKRPQKCRKKVIKGVSPEVWTQGLLVVKINEILGGVSFL